MIGPSMFDDDDDDWGFSSGGGFSKMKNKFFKNYINKYTITIDMKLIEELPRDGCSLFQTALVHVKDDKRSGKTTMSRSDGEAVINQAGGIGIFGTFGDCTKSKLEVGQWKRVVVTVSCTESSTEKGEIRTWVNTEAGAVIKEETITANERFAIDPDNLFLFSSAQSSMMPGNIAVRTIRVQQVFSTDKDVKANRAKDKVLSMFNESIKKQVFEQRKGLSLASLFPKPRPMWLTPSFVGMFGDAFIESTTLEGSSNLAWTYTVFNFVLQRLGDSSVIMDDSYGLSYPERVSLSDSLHVMEQSADVFKNMLKVLRAPTDSQLLNFLRKLKKFIQAISLGDSLMLPVIVENKELILLLERTGERFYKVVIVQTDPFGGLHYHVATPTIPEIRYRTCMVLRDVPKKNVQDDVFWLALFNMSIHSHEGDIDKFYDVLVPFLTGKPLEASLVETENAALDEASRNVQNFNTSGSWRMPQRSDTAYIRCLLEVLYYLLRSKGVSEEATNQIHLAICCEMVKMMENDLHFMLPHESDVRVCELAVRELSHCAVKVFDQINTQLQVLSQLSLPSIKMETKDTSAMLNFVHSLIETVNQKLVYSKTQDSEVPTKLDLSKPAESIVSVNDPTMTQFQDMYAWSVASCAPDPGQAVALRKYIPIDFFQIPKKASTKRLAIKAIRLCDKLATLIDNQTHCIKNDKFLIVALIEHVFTQVLPIPKPQGVKLSDSDLYVAARSSRRAASKAEQERIKQDEKNKKKEAAVAAAAKDTKRIIGKSKGNKKDDIIVDKPAVKYFGEKLDPDFAGGKVNEEEFIKQECIWNEPITYELQLELLLTIQRLVEQFASAFFSIHQNRSFDAVGITVTGCMAAISDSIFRQIAIDEPSEACCHAVGRTVDGRQLGLPGFGIGVGTFAAQCETIEIHSAELCIARTAVLDYFQSPQQRRLEKIFDWDSDYINKPGKNLIRYLRNISRDIGMPILRPHMQLIDSKPISSLLMKNFPELKCYRDIIFFWKYFLNPDRKEFPNYSPPEEPIDIARIGRMSAQLDFAWDEEKDGYDVTAFGNSLHCRPNPKTVNPLTGKVVDPTHLPVHRFPSTATPSFYVPAPAINTEDDVIYRPNLPSFEDKYGQVLNQRDSELLISYLTVPYMRLPLILSFFSSEDRIHKLQSPELRLILDSVLFEPGKYLRMDCTSVEPVMVPTIHTELLATPHGLLLNELCRSPDVVIRSVLLILKGAFACDTGSVADDGAIDLNTSTSIIIYVSRMGARIDNYLSFLIDWSLGTHDCIDGQLRGMEISDETLTKLTNGRDQIREILRDQFDPLFEDYLKRLDAETLRDPTNESLINRNSALACDLHSHKLLLYRNYSHSQITPGIAITLLGSFIYLTTRHTWNKMTKKSNALKIPEYQLYELLQVQRRRLVSWMNKCRQGTLDLVMQTSLQISSSLTGSMKTSAAILEEHNRWARILGDRSYGRWAVGSTRTTTISSTESYGTLSFRSSKSSENALGSADLSPPSLTRQLVRQKSFDNEVSTVEDTGMLGIEMDLQVGQMTLRSKHLSALIPDIANHPDVNNLFGDATIQASMIESAEHRLRYRLVGLHHEIDYWPTVHYVCPPLADEYEREYDPSELFDSEKWITSIFEPVRKAFFDGPSPPPMQFMMPEKALSPEAEVAVLIGMHQNLGGPFKLVYLFKRLKCLHVYECLTHGREWWYSLHMTTDYRYCLRELQPSYKPRTYQYPDWWIRGAGEPYPVGVGENLFNDIDGNSSKPGSSVVIIREKQHPANLSGGKEILIPSRLLYGLIPQALLDVYTFYQDESICPSSTTLESFDGATRYAILFIHNRCIAQWFKIQYVTYIERLRGYPTGTNDENYVIVVEIQDTPWKWNDFSANQSNELSDEYLVQITKLPGRTVKIFARPKQKIEKNFLIHKRIASTIESLGLLTEPTARKSSADEEALDTAAAGKEEMAFKIDAAVECDYEGKGEFWPCIVRRINDNNTYDLEYVNDYKWVGIQRGVDPTIVQNRGEGERKKRGEGVWHFDGMTESEDDNFRANENDGIDDDDDDNSKDSKKNSLNFHFFDRIHTLYEAAGFDEDLCVSYIQRLGSVPGVLPFTDIRKLAAAIEELAKVSSSSQSQSQKESSKVVQTVDDVSSDDLILLNLLYAPQRSRLHSILKTLVRIETAGYILGWTKSSNPEIKRKSNGIRCGCPPLDLIELPRLKVTFTAREDHEGVLRLYSVDHVDLFITDQYDDMTTKMLEGIPHSLLLTNVRGETQVLVPVIAPHRPRIAVEPFTTFLVFAREELKTRSERFFLYPVHVSLSFLLTKGLNSAVYLMLLRFLHRDYASVFRLADSTATDTKLAEEGLSLFKALSRTNDDRHPDAHACRMKISLVTIDSEIESPWDLTTECARYVVKLDSVSSCCRLPPQEELQLLESDLVVLTSSHSTYKKEIHNEYIMALCFNRQQQLRSILKKNLIDSDEVACRLPSRAMPSNWPYYQDNSVFGENYMSMKEITSADDGENSWRLKMKGGDDIDAPAEGWLVVACFHTLWSQHSIKTMPTVAELVPLYQDMSTFLSIRADCYGMVQVSKSLNIEQFPTILVLRDGVEVERITGHERVIERLVHSLSSNLKESDKICHAKRRVRVRLEKALELGIIPPAEEIEEKGQLSWTWDNEQCGESIQIKGNGMLAILVDDDDDDGDKAQWEYSITGRSKWIAMSPKTNKEVEDIYCTGRLYSDGYSYFEEYEIYPSDVEIGSYEVKGFLGYLLPSYTSIHVRRRGDRRPVPDEDRFLTKEQKERDIKTLEWKEKYNVYKRELKEKKRGKDVQALRGTIGMLPNTGIHTWTLHWNHEPSRNGQGDSFGICSDGCEAWGPSASPMLGSSSDQGCSLGMYANGEVYHNGLVIRTVPGIRQDKDRIPKPEPIPVTSTEGNTDSETSKAGSETLQDTNTEATTAPTPDSTTFDKPSRITALAPLFGKGCLVKCILDTSLNGGTLSCKVERISVGDVTIPVNPEETFEFSIGDVYSMLGGSELFPCISISPLDPEVEVFEKIDGSALVPTDATPQEEQALDEEGKVVSEIQKLLNRFPSVALMPHDDDVFSSEMQAVMDKKKSSVESTDGPASLEEVNKETASLTVTTEVQETAVVEPTTLGAVEEPALSGEVEVEQNIETPASTTTTAIEVPIEKVRWMFECEAGWELYSAEASRLLEENIRDGKQTFLLTIGETTHNCNLETKKLTIDTGDKEYRIRRHIVGEGLQGQWEMLSMKYEKPSALQGQGLLKILEKVWGKNETFSGHQAGLGFLFLYSLLSGDIRAKVTGSEYGGGWMGSNVMSSSFSFGGRRAMGSSSSDSHRFGLLLTQLLKDKQTKSLPASIINVLGRNRQVSLRMPKFKDSRKVTNTPFFNGWVDETEPRSPLAELFGKVVPIMVSMKRKGAFHFPPPPPHVELAPPPAVVTISKLVEPDRPELTDYGCQQRSMKPVTALLVGQLISMVNYRIGKDLLKPQAPLAVQDSELFENLFLQNSERLIIVNFGATWCHYCKSLAPVFRKLSMENPTASFFKVDTDECESLCTRFDIDSLPTTCFLRHGTASQHVLATIKGGGASFIDVFTKTLLECSTPDELVQLERFKKNVPEGDLQSILENLATTKSQVDILAKQPLLECNLFVSTYAREELNLIPVNPVLAFDVSPHDAAKTAPAQSVLTRFRDDVQAYANQTNTTKVYKMCQLTDNVVLDFFSPDAGNASSAEGVVFEVLERCRMLLKKLRHLQECDTSCITDIVPLLEMVANWVSFDSKSDSLALRSSKIRFLLNRFSGQQSYIWMEYLFGVLLSTQGEADLLKLNPYMSADTIHALLGIISLVMLRSNRLGQTNRCIGTLISLTSLLEKVLKISQVDRVSKGAVLAPKLIQLSEELSKMITMERYYMAKDGDSSYSFDPRYLVFEFVWNIQLREKQVEIVNDFRNALQNNQSKVKQMIMGAGKTSVVAPLLALILADGKSLVLSVVPKALVEMSRTRMRETFASIMVKRIYTLEFDRSTIVKSSMRRGLENATSNRGIVVATPTTLKSVMLSYVEVLHKIMEAHQSGARTKIAELQKQAEEFQQILKIFQNGTMLLDEVDLILHPLKSELNFPVGEKFDLDGSEDGERWSLPIHLLDAFLYVQTNRISAFEQRGAALDILKRLANIVQQGITEKHLQRNPHVTLLNPDFYRNHIMPIIAEWTFLWLQKVHLHGIDRNEAIQYILEGAAAKSDIVSKIHLLDAAIVKALIAVGDLPPEPNVTAAHKNLLTQQEIELKSMSMRTLQRQNSENISSNEYNLVLTKAFISRLEEMKIETVLHSQLVHEIYEIDDKIDKHYKDVAHKQSELQSQIMSLNANIAEIECPRDDSLDNCVVVWCSQAFAMSTSAVGSGYAASPGETSVLTICSHLEDAGLTIRRCSDADEAISRARDLQRENQLRCIIIGGDEHGMSCGPSCVKSHHGEKCTKCGATFTNHNNHECQVGGRGSFPLEKPSNLKLVNALDAMQTLIDEESPYARANKAVPPLRTAVYCADVPVKEADRMAFWKLGVTVSDDPKEILKYVTGLPSWYEATTEEDDEEESSSLVAKKSNHLDSPRNSDRAKLVQLKSELEQIETKKSDLLDASESDRKSLWLSATAKHTQLEEAVEKGIDRLLKSETDLKEVIDMLGYTALVTEETKKYYVGSHSGRDAAMALAFLQINKSRLQELARKTASVSDFVIMSNEKTEDAFQKTLIKHLISITNELLFLKKMSLASKVVSHVSSPLHKKLLNLCHGWLSVFLPHCLAKVNRVSFGLLTADDCKAALQNDPHVPRSRLKLAVPFIGKDVPSKASEFAHPDIIIGLTVLAYRYTGLRKDDFTDIIDNLTSQFTHEIGPARDRDSSKKHENWVLAAGGAIRGLKTTVDGKTWATTGLMPGSDEAVSKEVVQLKFLQKSNDEQMEKLFNLLQKEPLVIHDYLSRTVFPTHMRSQRMKISASGQAVGGDMLVGKRVGFSGTPSDLLPQELGRCDYETGDDGMMLTTVLDRKIASYRNLPDQWTIELVLDMISKSAEPQFNALIDTGALITGYSNKEVAQELLKRGLEWCDGVVFLDDDDKQQVFVRATNRVVSADQCGVSLEKRFAFYDQIHTTGMDIKHVVNATAAITLGKDMTFRDYVQGAYRMRGIGIGQKIHVIVIPEVQELIHRELKDCIVRSPNIQQEDHVLEDIAAWLVINSLRSEQTQWTMLCIQNIGNLYRKNSFKCILENTKSFIENEDMIGSSEACEGANEADKSQGSLEPPSIITTTSSEEQLRMIKNLNKRDAIELFNEEIDFSLEASVPDPVPFEKKLRGMLEAHRKFLLPHQHEIGHNVMIVVGQFAMVEGYAKRLDSEQEREQEQEQEKEVEQRRDQQVEVEKFVDREYSRQEEVQRPWPFNILAKPVESYIGRNDSEHPFYPLKEFKLRHQEPIYFPPMLMVSSNYFNPQWTGLRRVKNVVMVMEFSPSVSREFLHLKQFDANKTKLTPEQEASLIKAFQLIGFHAASAGKENLLDREDLRNAVAAVLDSDVNEAMLQNLIDKFGKTTSDHMTLDEFRSLLMCGILFPESDGRYFVALSLAEAETIRRILHVRTRKQLFRNQIILNHDTELALRYSLIASPGAPPAGDGGLVFDASPGWKNSTSCSSYEASVVHSCFRYFDCDMHFSVPALNLLIRALKGSNRDRERFFSSTVGCRRRMERKWQDTPLAKVFLIADEWVGLRQKAQTIFFVEALRAKGLTLWEAFTKFDTNNNGILSPAEFFGALRWLGVPNLTAEDVVDFIEAADKNRDGFIDYKEYIETYSSTSEEENDVADRVDAIDSDASAVAFDKDNKDSNLSKITPFGADELREIMIHRKQLELHAQREERMRSKAYKEALDVKVYEEELLEASRSRSGGSNPAVTIASAVDFGKLARSDSNENEKITITDFKFDRNQVPIRFVPTGKWNFQPIDIGTAADHPVKPMMCNSKHVLTSYNYYWMNCGLCRKLSTDWSCWNCYFHVCSTCYDGDKHFQEYEKRDCTKHPTFLKCHNVCSFTLQIPNQGGADLQSGDYTLSIDLRLSRLPPMGHLQSLFRFPLSDLELTRRLHRTSIYINSEGYVVARPIISTAVRSNNAGVSENENVKTIEEYGKGKIKPAYWSVASIVVSPSAGTVTSYVNGIFCHLSTDLDPSDFKLNHKIVVLGGGKQAHARGGDVRRLVIHSAALDQKSISDVFYSMATCNPGVGRRVAKLQALYRGYIYRKLNKIGEKYTKADEEVK